LVTIHPSYCLRWRRKYTSETRAKDWRGRRGDGEVRTEEAELRIDKKIEE